MKKWMVLLFLMFILLGSCFMGKDYDKETIAEAELATESYLKENYQDIEGVEVEKVHRG